MEQWGAIRKKKERGSWKAVHTAVPSRKKKNVCSFISFVCSVAGVLCVWWFVLAEA